MLDLLREGEIEPGAEAIAARAGVSLRTLFRHVEDLDELFAAAVDAQARHLRHLHAMAPPAGPPDVRVRAVVQHRARLFEEIGPVRRAAVRAAPFHRSVAAGLERSARELRHQVEAAFGPELRAAGAAGRRGALAAALDAATSWRAWEALRTDQGLPVHDAEAAMALMVTALVGCHDEGDPGG
jgi:AcrR family transcriptional regulator